jgi:thiamine monophosphate synthase
VSTHGYAELARTVALRPSYVALGPIYPTTLKAMRFSPQTPARLAEWRRLCDAPLVAIGGITLARVPEVSIADGLSVVADLRVGALETRARAYLEAVATIRS